jgi:ParB/RepB/Spo0J family partition protein
MSSNIIKGFEWISLDKLTPQDEELKVRPVVKDEAFQQLVTSIKGTGFLNPFLVIPSLDVKGTYTVLGGNRRLEAAKDAYAGAKETPKIPCIVGPEKLEAMDQIVLAAMDNLHRENLTPSQLFYVTKTLSKMGIIQQKEQAKLLGVSSSYLSQVLTAGKAGRIQRGGPVRPRGSVAARTETFTCPYPKCGGKIERAWDEDAGTYTYSKAAEAHARRA